MLKYLTVFFLSITLSGGALAKPQPKQHPPESAAATERPKDDKRGTKDAPLEVNARAVQTDKEAAEEASKDAEQKRVNRWNIGLTSAIAVCAGLQVFGIAAQVFVYLKQTALMKDTLDAIKEQARLMGEQLTDARKESVESAKTTADTVAAIQRQADLMDQQLAAIKRDSVLQFRPKVIVRTVAPEQGGIGFTLTNTGGSLAQLTSIVVFAVMNKVTTDSFDLVERLPPKAVMLAPGQTRRYALAIPTEIEEEIKFATEAFREVDNLTDVPKIFFAGVIRYRDEIGISRDTGVQRRYDPRVRLFLPAKGRDGDYSD